MKQLIFISLFFLLSSTDGVSDTIFFKDGNQLNVPDTWEEDGKIKFRQDNSTIVGYEKAGILKVEKNALIDNPQPEPKILFSEFGAECDQEALAIENHTAESLAEAEKERDEVIQKYKQDMDGQTDVTGEGYDAIAAAKERFRQRSIAIHQEEANQLQELLNKIKDHQKYLQEDMVRIKHELSRQ